MEMTLYKNYNSRLFKEILELDRLGKLAATFRVRDVINILGTSTPFLSKHAIDPNNPKKIPQGNAYFIRVTEGLYKINPVYK